MYWLRIESLKGELASGSVSEPEKFRYLIALILLYVISGELGYLAAQGYSEDMVTGLDWVSSALFVFVTFIGTYYCYRRNQSGDAKYFIDRFICLSWPITVRFIAVLLLCFAAFFSFGYMLGGDQFESWLLKDSFFQVAFFVILEVTYYWYLARHIYDTATRNA